MRTHARMCVCARAFCTHPPLICDPIPHPSRLPPSPPHPLSPSWWAGICRWHAARARGPDRKRPPQAKQSEIRPPSPCTAPAIYTGIRARTVRHAPERPPHVHVALLCTALAAARAWRAVPHARDGWSHRVAPRRPMPSACTGGALDGPAGCAARCSWTSKGFAHSSSPRFRPAPPAVRANQRRACVACARVVRARARLHDAVGYPVRVCAGRGAGLRAAFAFVSLFAFCGCLPQLATCARAHGCARPRACMLCMLCRRPRPPQAAAHAPGHVHRYVHTRPRTRARGPCTGAPHRRRPHARVGAALALSGGAACRAE